MPARKIMFRARGFTMTQFRPDILPQRVWFADEFPMLPLLPACLSGCNVWLPDAENAARGLIVIVFRKMACQK